MGFCYRKSLLSCGGCLFLLTGKVIADGTKETVSFRNRQIELDEIHQVIASEAKEEFGGSRLSADESKELWQHALENEWFAAHEREANASADRRRLELGTNQGASPFIVCDMNHKKPGQLCQRTIELVLGEGSLIPMINKPDMTCFAVSALASQVQDDLPDGVRAIPLTSEMKMAEGLVKMITESTSSPDIIEAGFCPGEILSDDDAIKVASAIQDELIDSLCNSRHLRTKSFLSSRASRDPERELMWTRHLSDLDQASFRHMISSSRLEASKYGLTFTLSDQNLPDQHRSHILALVADLAEQPQICFVEARHTPISHNDIPSGIVQSGNPDYKPFHEVGLDGRGQVVAMSDTGVEVDNCYFYDSQTGLRKGQSTGYNMGARKIVQYYAYADESDQPNGHGTHVAASIVGKKAPNGRSELGGRGDGIARGAKLAVMDIGYTSTEKLRTPQPPLLFKPGYAAGARVHSASWGTPGENGYTQFDRGVDDYIFQHPDFLFVVSVGNEGRGNIYNTVGSPATSKNSIAVGASQNAVQHSSEGPDYLAPYSSRGPTRDGRMKPEVVAPGDFIESARAVPGFTGECDDTHQSGLSFQSGTSMATPFVAGAAVLVRQYFIEGWHTNGNQRHSDGFVPSASLIKAVLLNGGDRLLGVDRSYPSTPYDRNQGFGRVNLLSSLPLQGRNRINGLFINSQSISQGNEVSYQIRIVSECQSPLSATLTWTDPPAYPGCRSCVLNDLDLLVVRQGGEQTFPNGRHNRDDINNAERIRIENPIVGAHYSVRVKGTQLLHSQDYSLAVTGCMEVVQQRVTSPPPPPPPSPPVPVPTPPPPSTSSTPAIPGENCSRRRRTLESGERELTNCSWLSQNIGTHRFLCNSNDVASECPVTCGSCDVAEASGRIGSAELSLDGDKAWWGITFELVPRHNMELTGMQLHLAGSAAAYAVKVTIREGRRSQDATAESLLYLGTVPSRGKGQKSPLPQNYFKPFRVKPNTYYTIQVSTTKKPGMYMTTKNLPNDIIIFGNDDILIRTGTAVDLDGKTSDGFAFNGSLEYQAY